MADITWNDVVALPAPELASVAQVAQDAILEYVNDALNPLVFGDDDTSPKYKRVRALLAAHMATMAVNAAEGPMIAETEGGLSRQWASQWTTSAHGQTAYGALYDQLIRTTLARVGFAT